jgi:hypothetical protein
MEPFCTSPEVGENADAYVSLKLAVSKEFSSTIIQLPFSPLLVMNLVVTIL